MSDSTIDRVFDERAGAWLADGPISLPAGALEAMRDHIESVAQERPRAAVVSGSPRRWLAAAGIIVAVVATGALTFRLVADSVAGPQPGDLLFGLKGASTLLERDGGSMPDAQAVTIDDLPQRPSLIIAGSCTGDDTVSIRVFDTSIQYGDPEDGAPIEPEPQATLDVPCDDQPHHRMISGDGTLELVLAVPAGATWRIAVGEYRAMRVAPNFASVATPDGWLMLLDQEPILVTSGMGLGPQIPDGAASVAIVLSCSGDPLTITTDPSVGEPAVVACDDPAISTRIEYPADGQLSMTIVATTAGVTWLDWQAEASSVVAAVRPTSPPLPAGLADVGFAEADGDYVAFGHLGSNEQARIRLAGSRVGHAAGDLVGVASAVDGGGERLELWSISAAAPIRELAGVDGEDRIYQSWIDATHGQLYYGVGRNDGSATWHRMALDGTGAVELGSAPIGITSADAALSLDDATFVVDWCTPAACTRLVDDAATGVTRTIDLGLDRTCQVVGAVAGSIVAWSASDCQNGRRAVTIQDVGGGPRTTLVGDATAAMVVDGATGPRLVYLIGGAGTSEVFILDLVPVAREPRSLGTVAHADVPSLALSAIRLPGDEWILIAGQLADTPSNAGVSRAVPRLLHLISGEQIELVNLPYSTD